MKALSMIGAIASVVPVLTGAQAAPERASFALLLRGDTIFDERVSRTPTEMRGEFRDRLRGARISYAATLDANGLITRLDARTFRTATDTAGEHATFVVTRVMAGTASPGRDIVMEQNRYVIDSVAHLTGAQRDTVLARARRAVDSAAKVPGWQGFFLNYDPTPTATRVRARVLILQGETDRQVPPAEAERLATAFRAGVMPNVTVRVFPATNHLFVEDSSGAFADATGRLRYPTLPSLHVRKDVLGSIADWLVKNL